MNDLKFAFRQLLRNPGFTAAAALTLALGIGANTTIFSVVNGVLLRPLPFAEAERLVWLGGWAGNDKEQGVTPADFLDYHEQCQSFAHLAASVSETVPVNLTGGGGEPERLKGALVTDNYLDVFGVRPALGRTFLAGEDQEGRDRVVVLSHGLWVRRFGGEPVSRRRSGDSDRIADQRRPTRQPFRQAAASQPRLRRKESYFRAMRIPLLKGRWFTAAEVRDNAKVVLISEVLAQRFFAGEVPLGQRLRPGWGKELYEIIGIVGDVRHRRLDIELRQTIYLPRLRLGYANLVVRTATVPGGL